MGTRGTVGFRIDGEDKLTYNHYDSYPEGLGVDVVKFINEINDFEKIKKQVKELTDITDRKPTAEDIKRCEKYTDLNVSEQSTEDWYCLLRNAQGNLQATLEVGFYEDNSKFINDSLFCEYGYIINLDNETLEIYKGFQSDPHNKGRYANYVPEDKGSDRTEYYACALVKVYPLNEIPENWISDCFPEDEEEE